MFEPKMEQAAKIFNKKLREIFTVDDMGELKTCYFNSVMLLQKTPDGQICANDVLIHLLDGRAEIVEENKL